MAGQALVQQLANGPEGGTLHSLTKYAVLSALKNPLLKAIMLAEDVVDMLAEVVQRTFEIREPTLEEQQDTKTTFSHVVDIVREQG